MVWEDVKIVDKYPKESFTARLEAVGIVDSKQGKPMVELTFADEVTVDISLGKVGDDRSLSGGMALGKFLRSLEVLGCKPQFDVVKDRIVDIRFAPEIVGRDISMVATTRTVVGPGGKSTDYTDWTVGEVLAAGTEGPKAKAEGKTSPPESGASYEELKSEWKTLLAENLEEGTSYDEGEVVKLLKAWVPDAQRKAALNRARGRVLKDLFAEKFLDGSLSGFTLGG